MTTVDILNKMLDSEILALKRSYELLNEMGAKVTKLEEENEKLLNKIKELGEEL